MRLCQDQAPQTAGAADGERCRRQAPQTAYWHTISFTSSQ